MSAEDTNYALAPGKEFTTGGRAMFKMVEVLGTGGFGITYHDGSDYALKEYFPRQFSKRLENWCIQPHSDDASQEKFAWGLSRFTTEATVLARCKYANIVKVIGASIR
jgi:hypothetical protein